MYRHDADRFFVARDLNRVKKGDIMQVLAQCPNLEREKKKKKAGVISRLGGAKLS